MRTGSRIVALTLALAALLAPAAAGFRPQPRASLPDIEDEVMCPVCGTLLELSESPQADRERVFIHKLIAEGRSKQQIKDALVAEYGRSVLATPQGSGFDLTAYLVPIIAALLAATALGIGVRRWRRSAQPEEPEPEPAAPRGEDAERLESDLARYDL
ncbi:MAG: cytochrome c-type biogenesis protein CcmH [Actinomycetota bacterium]